MLRRLRLQHRLGKQQDNPQFWQHGSAITHIGISLPAHNTFNRLLTTPGRSLVLQLMIALLLHFISEKQFPCGPANTSHSTLQLRGLATRCHSG